MKNLLLSILLVFTAGARLQASDEISLRIFRLIYNQQYDAARILLNENKDRLDRFYYSVLDIDLCYWENVSGTELPDYAAFENTLENYDIENPHSRDEQVISLIALSYKLRYDFKRYHFVAALQTRKRTMDLYVQLKESGLAPDQSQAEVFRLYNALIQYFNHYPKKYFSQTSRDEMQSAILEMEALTKSSSEMVKTLSSYFLGKIYLQYEKKPEKGITLFSYLTTAYPQNQKFQEYLEECRANTIH